MATSGVQYGSLSSSQDNNRRSIFPTGKTSMQLQLQDPLGQADNAYHCVTADDDLQLGPTTPYGRGRSSERSARYRRYAIALSLVSLVVTLCLGIVGFVGSVRSDNDAAFGFALNCILDFFSTLVVLWRFLPQALKNGHADSSHGDSSRENLTGEEAQSRWRAWWLRERRATIGIAILFVLAFVAVVCKALADILNRQIPKSGVATVVLSAICSVLFLALAWLKVNVAKELKSPAMRSDGINSLAGAVISMGVFVSWIVTRSHPRVWYVDAFVALLVGLGMFLYAIKMLIVMMSPDARTAPIY